MRISRQVKGATLRKIAMEEEAWMEVVRGQHWQHIQAGLSLFAVIFRLIKKRRV